MMNINNLLHDTSFIAWYGAIVATLGLLLTVIKMIIDRPRLRLDYKKDMQVLGAEPLYHEDKLYFEIQVTHYGRKPIKIIQAGFYAKSPNKKISIMSDSFTTNRDRLLIETSPSTSYLCEQELIQFEHLDYIYVQDARRKIYKKYIHKLPTLWGFYHYLKYRY